MPIKKHSCILCGKNEVVTESGICNVCLPLGEKRSFFYCKNCGKKYFLDNIGNYGDIHKKAKDHPIFMREGCLYLIEISFCKKCDPREEIEIVHIRPHKVFFRDIKPRF